MLEMMEYREQRPFIPEKRDEFVPRPVDREWAEIESIPTWLPFPRGKKRGGRLETLRFPDARRNRRKGLSVGNSVPGLRFLRPGEGGAAVSGRDGEAVGEPAFSPWPESKSSGKLYLPEDEKQSGKFPVLKGAFYRLAGPSMIALWLMFQPPPRAVYRETSVLACW